MRAAGGRLVVVIALFLLVALPAFVEAVDAPLPPGVIPADVQAVVRRITAPIDSVVLPSLPFNPVETLVRLVNTLSATAGVRRPRRAAPPDRHRVRRDDDAGRSPQVRRDNDAAVGVIRSSAPFFSDVQAWPVLYIDGDGGDDRHVYDYVVLIDRGGNDVPAWASSATTGDGTLTTRYARRAADRLAGAPAAARR